MEQETLAPPIMLDSFLTFNGSMETLIVIWATSLVLGAVGIAFWHRLRIKHKPHCVVVGHFLPLMSNEQHMLDTPSQSTATIYSGPFPEDILRKRVIDIVNANPWLRGRLRTDPTTRKIALWVPESAKAATKTDLSESDLLTVVRRQTEAAERICSPQFFVKHGYDLLDRDEAVCKIVGVVDVDPTVGVEKAWTLILSLSHLVADGATFYTVYGMLDPTASLIPLRSERLLSFKAVFDPFYNGRKFRFFVLCTLLRLLRHKLRRAALWTPVSRMLFGVSSQRAEKKNWFWVDRHWVEARKLQHVPTPEAPFLSTNDVLVSWFFSTTNPAAGAVVVNMRREDSSGAEVVQCAEEGSPTPAHAGNYFSLLTLFPDEYRDPAKIRVVVRAMKARTGPTRIETAAAPPRPGPGYTCGMCSNWATLYRDVAFPGCEQQLHFPTGSESEGEGVARVLPLPLMIVFQGGGGRVAVLTVTEEELQDTSPFAGQLFPGT